LIQPAVREELKEQQQQYYHYLDKLAEREEDKGLADACKATRQLIKQAF
jgi:hypothetical protein